jgi:hypothetical protein
MLARNGEGPAAVVTAREAQDSKTTTTTLPHASPPIQPQRTDDDEPSDFDWVKDKADIVLPEQPATAVYLNLRGDVVIRQARDYGEDDDLITVRPENIPALISGLQKAVAP